MWNIRRLAQVVAMLTALVLVWSGPAAALLAQDDVTSPGDQPLEIVVDGERFVFDRIVPIDLGDLEEGADDDGAPVFTKADDSAGAVYLPAGDDSTAARYLPESLDSPDVDCLSEGVAAGTITAGDDVYVPAGPEPDLDTDALTEVGSTDDGRAIYAPSEEQPFDELFADSDDGLVRYVLLGDDGAPVTVPETVVFGGQEFEVAPDADAPGMDGLTRAGCLGPFPAFAEGGSEAPFATIFLSLNDQVTVYQALDAPAETEPAEEPATPPEADETVESSPAPTVEATPTEEPAPTEVPTEEPTEVPPTEVPTEVPPTAVPTEEPTEVPPTEVLTEVPTEVPPTEVPTEEPAPTEVSPTDVPAVEPTEVPTEEPAPTEEPPTETPVPTEVPPTEVPPTDVPTEVPTEEPAGTQVPAPTAPAQAAPTDVPATETPAAGAPAAPRAPRPTPTPRVYQPRAVVPTPALDAPPPAVATAPATRCAGETGALDANGVPDRLANSLQYGGTGYRFASVVPIAEAGNLTLLGCVGPFEAYRGDAQDADTVLYLALADGRGNLFRYDATSSFNVTFEVSENPRTLTLQANGDQPETRYTASEPWVRSVYSSVTLILYVADPGNAQPEAIYGRPVDSAVIAEYVPEGTVEAPSGDLATLAEQSGLQPDLTLGAGGPRYVLAAVWQPFGTTTNGWLTLYGPAGEAVPARLVGVDPRRLDLLIFEQAP